MAVKCSVAVCEFIIKIYFASEIRIEIVFITINTMLMNNNIMNNV